MRIYHQSGSLHVITNQLPKVTCDRDSIIIPILWMEKLKPREDSMWSEVSKIENDRMMSKNVNEIKILAFCSSMENLKITRELKQNNFKSQNHK